MLFKLTHSTRHGIEIYLFDTEEKLKVQFNKIKNSYSISSWEMINYVEGEELWIDVATN